MNPDEIIRIANEVGYPLVSIGGRPYIPPLLAVLLEAAVEAERKAILRHATPAHDVDGHCEIVIAADIRARGEK